MKPRPTRTAVYLLATQLDEQVATYHFPAFGAVRTVLTQKLANYFDVKVEGTFNNGRRHFQQWELSLLSCKVQLKVLSLAAFSDCQGQLDSLCRSTPAQKSELRAHQMARNCGVPGSLRKKNPS